MCIEVKGRSGEEIVADFSPNEFATLLDHQKGKFEDGDYRICIVTDALNERKGRKLNHFSWWPEKQAWINVDGSNQLTFEPKTAAIASITKPKSKSRKHRTLKHHGRNQ